MRSDPPDPVPPPGEEPNPNGEAGAGRSRLERFVRFLLDPVPWLAARPKLAYVLMVVLLGSAFATLIALNILVRQLWGELVYGVVVTAIAFWALAQTGPVRRLRKSWNDPGFSLRRAFVWATFVVVALPVALVHPQRLLALAVLLVIPLGWALYRLVRHLVRRSTEKRQPWIPVAVGMLFLLIFVWRTDPAEEAETDGGAPPAPAAESPRDAELARAVRPLLLFDRAESRAPLDIDDAFRGRRIRNCEDGECGDAIVNAAGIDLGADHLAIEDVAGVRGGGGSAYYYHVVRGDNRTYVDYWWYFTRNPSPIGASVGCGPAARWVGLTCHDHPSDWEGVTVVLAPCAQDRDACIRDDDREWAPAAVRYAQHEHVVSYAWSTLLQLWRLERQRRPLVFVARDSHASYAASCPSGCKQYARYPWGTKRDEAPHDGRLPWKWNGDDCEPPARRARGASEDPDCLLPMPITARGLAASWNAYPGRWGSQRCVLDGAYCDTSKAPRSPSQQSRYRDPAAPGPWMCVKRDRPGRRPILDSVEDADPDEAIPARCDSRT